MPFLAAVEVEHADAALLVGRFGGVDVADQFQRHAEDVADAECDGPHVDVREVAVEQVRRRSAARRVRKTSSGILRLVAKLPPGSVWWPRPRAILNSSSPVALASMMKPRSAPLTSIAESSTSDSTSSSTRPDPSARSPSSSAVTWRRSPIAVVADRSATVLGPLDHEDHLGAAGATEPDPVAVRQRLLGDLLAVDVGAVARILVADEELVVFGDDVGVVARHLAAGQPQIVGLAAADPKQRLADLDDAAAECIGDFQASSSH